MVRSKINSRLSSISPVILVQTDTTVGFVSQNKKKLSEIKSRQSSKPFIKVYSSFKDLLESGNRVPKNKKNLVRRSKKTTFIVKNRAFRVSKQTLDSQALKNLKWNYSTSANESGKKFDLEFCEYKADIIIQNKDGLIENSSSSLIKINNTKKVRLRWVGLFKHF